ncbi:hypothetical protein BKA62DRAFT_707278 [Auriculariales sp. MPI-PUGE-AT-0066]|nr:hypothetical protein BKA62DRAFT_707278 [Auriculariales sp. MPI-PUGE-AT-0066]
MPSRIGLDGLSGIIILDTCLCNWCCCLLRVVFVCTVDRHGELWRVGSSRVQALNAVPTGRAGWCGGSGWNGTGLRCNTRPKFGGCRAEWKAPLAVSCLPRNLAHALWALWGADWGRRRRGERARGRW